MSPTRSNVQAPDVLWTIVADADGPESARVRACRSIWERACNHAGKWRAGIPDTVAVRVKGGAVVIVRDERDRLAAALVAPSAAVSVVRYELRELLDA
jgi:hypothetical protein